MHRIELSNESIVQTKGACCVCVCEACECQSSTTDAHPIACHQRHRIGSSITFTCVHSLFIFFFAGASYPPVMILHIIHTISMATPYQPCAAHGYKKYREEVEEEKTNDSSDIQYHNIKWYQFPCHRFLFY